MHAFDPGSEAPPVIAGCKSHIWTKRDLVPSAKMKNWAEAMFYVPHGPADVLQDILRRAGAFAPAMAKACSPISSARKAT